MQSNANELTIDIMIWYDMIFNLLKNTSYANKEVNTVS